MKILVFGGDNLPKGTSTWYDRIRPDGEYGGQIRADPGHRVPVEQVGKIVGQKEDGKPELIPNSSYYVETKRASIVDEADAASVTPKK